MFEVSSSRGSRHCLKIKAQNPGENLHVPQRLRSLNKNDYRNEKHECNHFTELFSLLPEVTWNLPTWLGDGPTPCNFGARVVTVNANHREPAWLAHILNACISPPDGLLCARCQAAAAARESAFHGRAVCTCRECCNLREC